jgi:hypothetical protein
MVTLDDGELTYTLPHVLEIQITSAHEEIERPVPMRTIPYRADKAELGRTVRISGEIRETNLDDLREAIDELRSLCGYERTWGTATALDLSLDLEDGTAAFAVVAADPEYELAVGEFNLTSIYSVTGKFYVPYTLSLLEVEAS